MNCYLHSCVIVHLLPVYLRPVILLSESVGWFLLLIVDTLFFIISADGHMKVCYFLNDIQIKCGP